MSAKNTQLPGLNVYRALAVILMILAHAARMQTDMGALRANPAGAGLFDWPLLGTLIIEPIISAMFLFMAGFSLVLSLRSSRESASAWLGRLGRRMGTLYLISVVFALADQGVQWPGVIVSSGVLGIIAVGIFTTGLMLVAPRSIALLAGSTLVIIGITYTLDSARASVIGLNAGAGGMVPLVVLAYLGALTGMIYQRAGLNGLGMVLAATLLTGALALASSAPWITQPPTTIHQYPGDRVQAVWHSLLDVVGLYDGPVYTGMVRYWNHSWIFPLRALPILVAGLILFLGLIRHTRQRALQFLDWMGRQALNLYILHLVLLAGVEVSGIKPVTGWQTLLMVALMLALAPWLLRWISFVPFRIYGRRNGTGQTS